MSKIFVILLVIVSTSLIGCKKDDDDEDTPTLLPDQLFLDSLIIEEMPFVDESGAGWDVASGPDVFFRLLQGSTTLSTSNVQNDRAPGNLPLLWLASPPYEIETWTTDVIVDIWEYDDIADDYVGNVVFDFETLTQQNGYVNSYTVSNASETIRVRMAVYWQYP